MKIKVILDKGAKMPTKAHKEDAGFDLYSREDKHIPSLWAGIIDTGVHMEIPSGYTGFLKSKSGLNVKHGIQGEGVIDAGYTGSIVVKLYNNSSVDYTVHKGDKISQIVLLPIPDVELVEADEFDEHERGDNGFGSSGR